MNEAEPLALIGRNAVLYRGRKLLNFSGCDYFRLARRPQVSAGAVLCLKQNGLNVAASRLTTGNHPIYERLEGELADFFDAESAVLLPDGYFAPLAAAQALTGEVSHAFVDEFAHGALRDAARMLDCPVKTFRHREVADLKKMILRAGRKSRPIVLTDGMFAHDGSIAPLRQYLGLLPETGRILVDDAHGAGVLGRNGRGTLEAERVGRRQIIQCATLSKAFGAYGGVVLGTRELRAKIVSHSRVFVGTTPLPPPLAGAALESLRILRSSKALRSKLFSNLALARRGLRDAGWEIAETQGPIIRLSTVEPSRVAALKSELLAAGIYPPFLVYPGGSAAGVFRFVISSGHGRGQLNRLISVLEKWNRG